MQALWNQACDKAKLVKTVIGTQDITKIVIVGSAVALFSFVAISFLRGNDESGNEKDKKNGKEREDKLKEAGSKRSKKKFMPEKKAFTEEEPYSDEVSTSNAERARTNTPREGKKKPTRFMSETEEEENDSKVRSSAGPTEEKVQEEADDLYFHMLNKLHK